MGKLTDNMELIEILLSANAGIKISKIESEVASISMRSIGLIIAQEIVTYIITCDNEEYSELITEMFNETSEMLRKYHNIEMAVILNEKK